MTQTVIVVIYLGLLLSLGYLSSRLFRGNSNDYFVASRSIGPLVLFMSIFGTTMTAFAMVGSTGESYRVGIATYGKIASSPALIHSACFFLVHLSFLRCLAKLAISRLHATLGVCKCVTTRKLSATSPKGFRHFGPL